jgi:hypothetical protein
MEESMKYACSLVTMLAAAGLMVACGDPDAPSSPTAYGAPVDVGNGQARSYVVQDHGTTVEVGIALSEAALDGLPEPTGTSPDSHVYLLPLPAADAAGYQVIELDWNPAGHPPPMVYTVPHFDFHFYTMSPAERNSILPTDPDFVTKAENYPPESLRPAGYVPDTRTDGSTIGVPLMGVHWIDHTSHEFHGSAFTATFVYGAWNGAFTFTEPMVAYDYLKTQPDTIAAVTVPAAFASASGHHPTGYRVTWDAGQKEYRIGITGIVKN